MRIAIAAAAACLVLLAGCQSSEDETEPTPVDPVPGETTETSPEPTEDPTDDPTTDTLTMADLEGSWTSDDGSEMTFNLTADGTYTLDVGEATEISSGTVTLDGTTLTFVEGEADGLVGEVDGDSLVTPTVTYVKQ